MAFVNKKGGFDMRSFILLLGLLGCSVSFAGDAEEIHNILQANFAACNNEDVDALLATCSVDMPDRKRFRDESIRLWKEKDIHYSLVEFKIISIEGPYAAAEVVQKTHATDRKHSGEDERFFRNGTGLLPDAEVVCYVAAFKKDFGKWKCYMTISEPIPVE